MASSLQLLDSISFRQTARGETTRLYTVSDSKTADRVFYVDAIRSTAAFLVVSSHVFAPVCAGLYSYPAFDWWTFNLSDSIIRPCVALFIMISGKLLLGSTREVPYVSAVWKRYSRLLLPFFVWSVIYAYYEAHLQGTRITIATAMKQFFQGPTEYHLWFMYLILALYLVAPLLRRFVHAATQKESLIALGLWFGFITAQFLTSGIFGTGPTCVFVSYAGYFVLGYVLDRTSFTKDKTIWLVLAASIIVVFDALATYLLTIENNGILNELFYTGCAPLVAIQGAAFFLILKNITSDRFISKRPWLRHSARLMSRESYNVYLIHPLVISLFVYGRLGFTISEKTGPNALVGVGLTTLAALVGSLGLSVIFKRIPLVSRLLVSR